MFRSLAWLCSLSLFLLACQPTALTPNAASPSSVTAAQDKGSFSIKVEASALNKDLKPLFDELATALESQMNKTFVFPKGDVSATFGDCGRADAFYQTGTRQIGMCYELFADLASKFSIADSVDVFRFIFLHELGHALIDQFDLPILGREEDAADSLATVFSIEEDQNSRGALLAGINFLDSYQKGFSSNWADNHSLGPQRMFNLVCWTVGGDPTALSNRTVAALNQQLASSGRNCSTEYSSQKQAYTRLLEPFIKTP